MRLKKILMRIFGTLIDFEHILTPIAIEHLQRSHGERDFQTYRLVYLFGVRVAFYSTTKI